MGLQCCVTIFKEVIAWYELSCGECWLKLQNQIGYCTQDENRTAWSPGQFMATNRSLSSPLPLPPLASSSCFCNWAMLALQLETWWHRISSSKNTRTGPTQCNVKITEDTLSKWGAISSYSLSFWGEYNLIFLTYNFKFQCLHLSRYCDFSTLLPISLQTSQPLA